MTMSSVSDHPPDGYLVSPDGTLSLYASDLTLGQVKCMFGDRFPSLQNRTIVVMGYPDGAMTTRVFTANEALSFLGLVLSILVKDMDGNDTRSWDKMLAIAENLHVVLTRGLGKILDPSMADMIRALEQWQASYKSVAKARDKIGSIALVIGAKP